MRSRDYCLNRRALNCRYLVAVTELRQLVIQQKSDSVDRSDVTVTDDSATETATKNLLGHDVTTSTG